MDTPDRPSKTRRKHQADAVQDLGATLSALKPAMLANVPLREETLAAIAELRRTKTHEARRRQLQRIGKLMREEDEIAVRIALIALNAVDGREQRRFRLAQTWRERLLRGGVDALDAFAEYQHGLANAQRRALTQLLERDDHDDPATALELFQLLHRMLRVG